MSTLSQPKRKLRKIIKGPLVVFAVLIVCYFSFKTHPVEETTGGESASSPRPAGESDSAQDSSQNKGQKKPAEQKTSSNSEKEMSPEAMELHQLLNAFHNLVQKLHGKPLQSLREKALKVLRKDEKVYEQFLWETLQKPNEKREAKLFFTEVFTSHAAKPTKMSTQILGAKDWGAEAPLLKGFVINSLFIREQSGEDFVENPLPHLEKFLLKFAKKSAHKNLVEDSLLNLKEQYNYSQSQLEEIIWDRSEAIKIYVRELFTTS